MDWTDRIGPIQSLLLRRPPPWRLTLFSSCSLGSRHTASTRIRHSVASALRSPRSFCATVSLNSSNLIVEIGASLLTSLTFRHRILHVSVPWYPRLSFTLTHSLQYLAPHPDLDDRFRSDRLSTSRSTPLLLASELNSRCAAANHRLDRLALLRPSVRSPLHFDSVPPC